MFALTCFDFLHSVDRKQGKRRSAKVDMIKSWEKKFRPIVNRFSKNACPKFVNLVWLRGNTRPNRGWRLVLTAKEHLVSLSPFSTNDCIYVQILCFPYYKISTETWLCSMWTEVAPTEGVVARKWKLKELPSTITIWAKSRLPKTNVSICVCSVFQSLSKPTALPLLSSQKFDLYL